MSPPARAARPGPAYDLLLAKGNNDNRMNHSKPFSCELPARAQLRSLISRARHHAQGVFPFNVRIIMSTEVKQLEPVEQTNSESVTDAQHDPAPVCSLQQGDTAEAIATAQNEPQAAQVDEAPDANVAPEAANKDSKTVTEVSAKASPKKRKGNNEVRWLPKYERDGTRENQRERG